MGKVRAYGQGLVEYALVLILIAIVVIGILSVLRGGNPSYPTCPAGTVYSRDLGCVQRYP
jgi:hypothetical protein